MPTNLFIAQIYGIDGPGGSTEIASASGESNAFNVGTIHVYPTTEVRGVAQVQCNAVIEVLPTGLNQISKKFFTDKTVVQVQTAANA